MYVHEVRVRFYHTDGMQVSHHANYILWMEAARVEFFRWAGVSLNEIMADGIVFPILHAECDYLHSSRYDDLLEIRTKLVRLSRAQIVFRYEIFRPADQQIIARGLTKGTFTSVKTGRIIRLPQEYYERLAALAEPEDCE